MTRIGLPSPYLMALSWVGHHLVEAGRSDCASDLRDIEHQPGATRWACGSNRATTSDQRGQIHRLAFHGEAPGGDPRDVQQMETRLDSRAT